MLYRSCTHVGHRVMLHGCVAWVLGKVAISEHVSDTHRHARRQQAHQNGA